MANAVSVQIDAETGEVITQVDAPAYDLKAEINRVAEALLGKQEPPPDRGEALDKLASDVAAESTPPTDPFKALADEAFKKLAAPSEVELADDDFDDEEIIGGIDSQTPPADDEVRDGRLVFGVVVTLPNPEWHQEELTREGGSGDGGQLKAVNSALSSSGFGGKLRHPAALAILRTFGRIDDITSVREELASINDLTKAEAHVILTWYERAAAYPDAFRELAAAVHIVSAALRKEAA